MGRQEIMATRFGEMRDMISCLAIYNGSAVYKAVNTVTNYDESLEVM